MLPILIVDDSREDALLAQRVLVGDVASGQHRQCAEAHGSAQQLAAIDLGGRSEPAGTDAAGWPVRLKG